MKAKLFLLFIVVLFVSSCDETTGLLGTSLSEDVNNLTVENAIFDISSRSKQMERVINKSSIGYLGYVKDPETSSYIKGDFLTQFHITEDYSLPSKETIVSLKDGNIIADSCELRLYYRNFYGDSLATMKVEVSELLRSTSETDVFYSDFDPEKEGFIRSDGLRTTTTYTLADHHLSDTQRSLSTYVPHIKIALNDNYTAKDGRHYDNYGSYVMNTYYEHPEYFKNSMQVINNVIPGMYFKHSGGMGSMAYIASSALNIYFRYVDNDSTYNAVMTLVGTEEVLQASHITNTNYEIESLVNDETCTYLKTPAGIYTELTLPIDNIMLGHENDTINTARLIIPRIKNEVVTDYTLPYPRTLLILPADSIETFFAKGKIPDNKTTFLAEYTTTKTEGTTTPINTYTFSNISSLVSYLYKCKVDGLNTNENWLTENENWNKVAVIPVALTQVYDATSGKYETTKVANEMSLTSTKIVGGSNSLNGKLQLSVIYSSFRN